MAVLATLTLGAALLGAQVPVPPRTVEPPLEKCLHAASTETPAERERRVDAVAAMRMIGWVLHQDGSRVPQSRSWSAMRESSSVTQLKSRDDRVGDLAKRLAWGTGEPLPGWRMHWASSPMRTAYSLTDTRDPCALTLRSTDPDVIGPPSFGVIPLEPDAH